MSKVYNLKTLLFSLITIFFSSLVSLVALEHLVRGLIPAFDPTGHIKLIGSKNGPLVFGTPNSQMRQIKNTGDFDVMVRFNKYGLRDDRDFANSSFDDIFVAGDSISFGWGVDEKLRVSEQLELLLNEFVFNISMPTSLNGTAQLITHVESLGAKVKKLIFFFSMEARMLVGDDIPVPTIKKITRQSLQLKYLKRILTRNSALYFMATSFVHQTPRVKRLALKLGLINPNFEGLPYRKYDDRMIKRTARWMQQFESGNNYNILFVIIPSRALWTGPNQADENLILAEFIKTLEKLKLNVLNLRHAFEADGNPLGRLYFANDGHWNSAGHAVAAEAVAKKLGR